MQLVAAAEGSYSRGRQRRPRHVAAVEARSGSRVTERRPRHGMAAEAERGVRGTERRMMQKATVEAGEAMMPIILQFAFVCNRKTEGQMFEPMSIAARERKIINTSHDDVLSVWNTVKGAMGA